MIKECPVVINNDAITTFIYDGTKVQIPSIKREARTVFVKKENGRYLVVDDKENINTDEPKKKTNKKSKKAVLDDKEVVEKNEESEENFVL